MITKEIGHAKSCLINNNLVAIPTETVYGLGGNAFNETAIKKIFELKKRPLNNPLIVHIPSKEMLKEVATDIPDKAIELVDCFWPGPLTVLLNKKNSVPDLVTSGKKTVAVRMPRHEMTLSLLSQIEFPLVAPSANPFGCISPTSAMHVYKYFKKELSCILDGGDCDLGIESTIIGFENDHPIVYRLGSVSIEEIEKMVGSVSLFSKNDRNPPAPGMFSRHYAPSTPTYLSTDVEELLPLFEGKRVGLLVFSNKRNSKAAFIQEVLSEKSCLNEAASHLYAALHRLDAAELDVIIAEKLPDIGLGKTINDRLQRAIK